MADCRIVNASVVQAVQNIKSISNEYKSAGENFMAALTAAISEMEGETKDSLQNFFNTDVQKFVVEDLPAAINGMSQLLEANRGNFEQVDKQIADSIAGSK